VSAARCLSMCQCGCSRVGAWEGEAGDLQLGLGASRQAGWGELLYKELAQEEEAGKEVNSCREEQGVCWRDGPVGLVARGLGFSLGGEQECKYKVCNWAPQRAWLQACYPPCICLSAPPPLISSQAGPSLSPDSAQRPPVPTTIQPLPQHPTSSPSQQYACSQRLLVHWICTMTNPALAWHGAGTTLWGTSARKRTAQRATTWPAS
jgi:hypothetical protein